MKKQKRENFNFSLNNRFIKIAFCFFFVSGLGILFFCMGEDTENVINISTLSQEFMDNYFAEVAENNANEDYDKENMLIVISKNDLKDTYGAVDVIEAPNHQYFLQYDSEGAKELALQELQKNQEITVEENEKIELDDIEEGEELSGSSYNSWGVKKMGLDHIINDIDVDTLNTISVAILDTGCDMVAFNNYYSGKIVNSYNVLTTQTGVENMSDTYGHGTHIAGTIAESTPANVSIVPIKLSDAGSLYTDNIINGINWITYNHSASVINMSFGGSYFSQAEYDAIEAAKEAGIISIAASGNEYADKSSYPGGFDNTISVGAVNSSLEKASFSNSDSELTFSAPGVNILSLNITNNGGGLVYMSGTSMATPHVVSAVAVLQSFRNDLNLSQTINVLREFATDLGPREHDPYFGYGMISFSNFMPCDNTESCDDLNIYKVAKITDINPVVTDYNYGSLTNILATEVTLIVDEEHTIEKYLWELDDAEITGYDAYASDSQEVTLNYGQQRLTFSVTNPTNFESGWEYEVSDDNNIQITGYKAHGKNIGTLYFPEIIDGKTVVETSGLRMSSNQESKNYQEIILPESLVKVGDSTFSFMPLLYKFRSLADELSLGYMAFVNDAYLEYVYGNITLDGMAVFAYDPLLKEITTLSEQNTTIPYGSFFGCTRLSSIILPEAITTIGEEAFRESGITSVNLPGALETISAQAFYDSNLETISIPASVSSIGSQAFSFTPISSISVDENNSIYDSRDNCDAIIETEANKLVNGSANTVIPNTVTTIASAAFEGINIRSLVIPETVNTIEESAFINCSYLSKLVLLSKSEFNLHENAFGYGNGESSATYNTVYWVFSNSFAKNFVIEKNFSYKIMDEELKDNDKNIVYIEIWLTKINYLSGERVEDGDIDNIKIYYNDNSTESITEYTIEYQYGDCFKYKDDYYDLIFNTAQNYNNLKSRLYVNVTSSKIIPTYKIPSGISAYTGTYLRDIEIPNTSDDSTTAGHFEWMYPDSIVYPGNTYRARFIPDDTDTYEVIPDILIPIEEITFTKTILYNTYTYFPPKYYDGTMDIDKDQLEFTAHVDGNIVIDSGDYEVVYAYIDSPWVGNVTLTYKLRLSDEKFENYAFSNRQQEMEFTTTLQIKAFKEYFGFADGEEHSITNYLAGENCSMSFAENWNDASAGNYPLDALPSYNSLGYHTIFAKITCENHPEAVYENSSVNILGIESQNSNVKIKGNIIITNSNKLSDVHNNTLVVGLAELIYPFNKIINNDGNEITIPHDDEGPLYEQVELHTGYKLYIDYYAGVGLEEDGTKEYEVAVQGDVNGDGGIGILDYIKIKKDIMSDTDIDKLSGVYFQAADMNENNGIDILDYIKIKKIIMGEQ